MSEKRNTKGLEAHNEEMKRLTYESVSGALLILMDNMEYDKISVSDICRKAGISRTAFYKNFETKENVFRLIVVELNKQMLENIGNPFNIKVTVDWYKKYFEHIKENIKLFNMIIKTGFQRVYLEYVNQLLVEQPGEDINAETKYQRLMWNGAIQNATIWWVENDTKEEINEMASICYDRLEKFRNKKRLPFFPSLSSLLGNNVKKT